MKEERETRVGGKKREKKIERKTGIGERERERERQSEREKDR